MNTHLFIGSVIKLCELIMLMYGNYVTISYWHDLGAELIRFEGSSLHVTMK